MGIRIRRGRGSGEEVERERGSDEEEDEGFDPMNRAARHGSEPECVGQVGAGSEPRPAWCGWVKRLARLDPTGNAVGGSGKTMTRTSPQHDGRSPWVDFSLVCQFATHGSIFFLIPVDSLKMMRSCFSLDVIP